MEKGTLYIVATPIGNLEDITFRAVRVLKEVDMIAAEDTRHSRKLLTHLGISKPLTSYFDHNKAFKGVYILDKLMEGLSIALVSDAGTPCISDPGYQLVRDAVAAGIKVVPVPGPSASIAALSASGLQTDSFAFEGFLPSRQGKRRNKLSLLKDERRVVIFYESPKRLLPALSDMLEIFGDRKIVICREISKIYEEFLRGRLSEILPNLHDRQLKGEVIVLVAPADTAEQGKDISIRELLQRCMVTERLTMKDAVKKVVQETGATRGVVYREALSVYGRNKSGCMQD